MRYIIVTLFSISLCLAQSTTKIGNTWFNDDGSSTTKIGNTYFHSNGSSTTKIGNTYFHDKSDRNTYNLTPILDDEEKKAKKDDDSIWDSIWDW